MSDSITLRPIGVSAAAAIRFSRTTGARWSRGWSSTPLRWTRRPPSDAASSPTLRWSSTSTKGPGPAAAHPARAVTRPGSLVGVLAGHSPVRPNRLGVSRCVLLDVSGLELTVQGLDAIDGTLVLDIKALYDRVRTGKPGCGNQPGCAS